MPSVSLIVSSYNQLDFLKIALASAVNQSVPYDEIIVVDDASTDASPDFLRAWEREDDNRQVVLLEQNQGPGKVRNVALSRVTSDYVSILDGDDWQCPEAMAQIKDVVEDTQPDVMMFRTNFYSQAEGRVLDKFYGNVFYTQDMLSMGVLKIPQKKSHLFRTMPALWAKVYRMAFLRENKIKCTEHSYEAILWHYQCAVLANEIHCVDKPIVNYRMHKGSLLGQQSALHFELIGVLDICEEFMQSTPQAAGMHTASHRHQYHMLANTVLHSPRVPDDHKPRFASEILKRPRLMALEMDAHERDMLGRLQALAGTEQQLS